MHAMHCLSAARLLDVLERETDVRSGYGLYLG